MSKRYISIFTIIMFIITLLPMALTEKVNAYSNTSYSNDLKVGLVSMSSTNITITLGGEYTVNGQVYPSGSVLNLEANGTSVGLNGTLQSQVNIIPSSRGSLLTITSGTASYKYMGSFIIKIYNGKILPINTIDIENYLKGVVGYEMSDYFPIEALKAQAVAARNYALAKIGYEAAKGYDFDDTVSYQVYRGYNSTYTRVLTAVDQTKGQVLLYNDKLVETLYSASHGGVSENSENVWGNVVPYLRSVQDTYENEPWPNGNKVLTNAQIQSILITKGYITSTDTFIKLDLESVTNFTSGRVASINIIYQDALGTINTKSVVRDNTRTFLSLPSNLYTVTYDSVNGTYTFSGRGNGHGLGMSQIGAKNRAAAGQTFDQILKFYYQNTYLQTLAVTVTEPSPTTELTVNNPVILTVTTSGSFYEGKVINFNASSVGASTSGFSYKYEVYNNGTLVTANSFNSSSTFSFAPSIAGNYTVKVYGKDGITSNPYDSVKQFDITIDKKPLYLSKLPLSYGMTNNDVASLQNAIIKLGYSISDKTGYFGNGTKNAVISFQKSKGLSRDGIVGKITYGALNDELIQKAGTKILTY